ncbi:DUF2254 domain-containing protein [Deinococcus humi]|uniref:Putative membrane protein n=1 Tax=Deinococcus humi TaxID=662880 RepID=A0A7W8JXG9_9DEIO|nr:DUF2254 domain-containing protein [Deinococcus humi]MBB5364939.1 putative membrane protein [Deinococcus humi]GGO35097.1 hypothetical protein GCM10008949_36950 [Deinococcus humi]
MKRTWLRLRQISQGFWFIPAVMTLLALVLAEAGISAEETYGVPDGLTFVYGGGETGSRSLLSAIAGSSIGVAGTVFSITIAALSYAAGSMGPRLLDNFTRDRGNQLTLGTFIATFAFALYTLRTVTGSEDQPFVPHYNVTFALVLAIVSVAMLVYYLAHVTGSINMTHVANLLRDDMRDALMRATLKEEPGQDLAVAPPPEFWAGGEVLHAPRSGYLQLTDNDLLLRRAEEADVALLLHVRPGDYVFPNSVIAVGVPRLPADVIDALTLGDRRTVGQDLEYSVRQLSEVAARALSPGVNDPVTAIDIIDRFGDALCSLQDRRWPDGVYHVDHVVRLVVPVTDFVGLAKSMFSMIRQYGKGSPSVMVRMLEVFSITASCLKDAERRAVIRWHAELVREDALANIENSADRADIEARYRELLDTLANGQAAEVLKAAEHTVQQTQGNRAN